MDGLRQEKVSVNMPDGSVKEITLNVIAEAVPFVPVLESPKVQEAVSDG
jgi:hypothetical protein